MILLAKLAFYSQISKQMLHAIRFFFSDGNSKDIAKYATMEQIERIKQMELLFERAATAVKRGQILVRHVVEQFLYLFDFLTHNAIIINAHHSNPCVPLSMSTIITTSAASTLLSPFKSAKPS